MGETQQLRALEAGNISRSWKSKRQSCLEKGKDEVEKITACLTSCQICHSKNQHPFSPLPEHFPYFPPQHLAQLFLFSCGLRAKGQEEPRWQDRSTQSMWKGKKSRRDGTNSFGECRAWQQDLGSLSRVPVPQGSGAQHRNNYKVLSDIFHVLKPN